ncbi:MAG: DUF3795 domain-containing protein [Candidatus Bathyarchaeota archaeon]
MSDFDLDRVGVCGVYCGFCPVHKEKCPGCREDPQSVECALYSCASKKNVMCCFECNEFPCLIHYEKGVYTEHVQNNWKKMMKK